MLRVRAAIVREEDSSCVSQCSFGKCVGVDVAVGCDHFYHLLYVTRLHPPFDTFAVVRRVLFLLHSLKMTLHVLVACVCSADFTPRTIRLYHQPIEGYVCHNFEVFSSF